jgi:hypothetical protein
VTKHDRDAAGLEAAHDREQALDLGVGEGAVGSSMTTSRASIERRGDLDHLLLGHREVGHRPVRVEVEPDLAA